MCGTGVFGTRNGVALDGGKLFKSRVTAVTEYLFRIGETPFVDMVREAAVKTSLEPGDTRQPWKGEAAANLVCVGIASSRVLPTSSAGYWPPTCYLVIHTRASGAKTSSGGVFLFV